MCPWVTQGNMLISNFPLDTTVSPQFQGDTSIAFGFSTPSVPYDLNHVKLNFTFGLPGDLSVGVFEASDGLPGQEQVGLNPTTTYQYGLAFQDYLFVPDTEFTFSPSTNYFLVFQLDNPDSGFAQINWTVSENPFTGSASPNQGFLLKYGNGEWENFAVAKNFSLEISANAIPEPNQILMVILGSLLLMSFRSSENRPVHFPTLGKPENKTLNAF